MALIIAEAVAAGPQERWVRFDDDTEVLLRSLDDEAYQIGLARVRRQIARADEGFKLGEVGVVEGEITEYDFQCKLLAQYVLKDWRGANDAQGHAVAYTPEAGAATLRADVRFFLFVIKAAGEIAAEVQKARDETVGKPLPAGAGKSGRRS